MRKFDLTAPQITNADLRHRIKRWFFPPALGLVFAGCALTSPAQADQSKDAEIDALKDEIASLRALVESLIAADDRIAVSESEDEVIILSPAPDQGAAPLEPSVASETGILTSRQPLGRVPDDALVTRGTFERSISVPGTNSGAFRVGGNVIVNANFDPDNFGFQDISFQPTIPLNGTSEDDQQQTRIHTRLSRVNFDYRQDSELGEFRTFVEFDFFGDGDELVNDYDLRLRHAVAELGNWKFGQFWSGFMDVFSQPETADAGGPIGLPSKRNPGIFYVSEEQSVTSWGFGIENPEADIAGRIDLQRSEAMPNLVGFGKIQDDWGYVRLAAMALQMRSQEEDLYTGGFNLSGRLNTPLWAEQDNLAFSLQYGEGFAHFYSSFAVDLDGIIRDDGDIEATEILGGFAAYQHWWAPRLRSTFAASYFDFDLPDGFDPFAYAGGERYTVNLVWTPTDGVTLGGELNYEEIETFDGSMGDGTRLEFVARFDF
ncbi:MAG: DcaP family trimeric outer membrane transporter [Pseudomonadota bacterium]